MAPYLLRSLCRHGYSYDGDDGDSCDDGSRHQSLSQRWSNRHYSHCYSLLSNSTLPSMMSSGAVAVADQLHPQNSSNCHHLPRCCAVVLGRQPTPTPYGCFAGLSARTAAGLRTIATSDRWWYAAIGYGADDDKQPITATYCYYYYCFLPATAMQTIQMCYLMLSIMMCLMVVISFMKHLYLFRYLLHWYYLMAAAIAIYYLPLVQLQKILIMSIITTVIDDNFWYYLLWA